MPRFSKRHVSAFISLATSAALAPAAFGGGFEVPMQNARAAGQADAFIVQADDASAVWYNPAGLTQVKGTQITGGAIALFMNWNFEADSGSDQTMNDEAYLPHLYVSSDFGTERFRAGLGINNSFGLQEDWGDLGPLRFVVDDAKLACINISPAVAYEVVDGFSLGFALNVYYARASLDRQVLLGAPPTPEGNFDISGAHDWAVGYTPSFLWKIDERNAIGGFYRSEVSLDVHGDAELTMGDTTIIPDTRVNLPIMLPQQIGLGYAMRPIEPLKLEFNVIWTDWQSLDRFRFSSDNPAFNGQEIPADWKSGFTYRLGAQYELNENWTLRAGYAYADNAIPEVTFTPIVPDSDYHLIGLGVGYHKANWAIDLAYQFIYRETRHIDGAVLSPTIDGDWQNTIHTVALTASYTF